MKFQTTTVSIEELREGFARIQDEAEDELTSKGIFFAEEAPKLPFGCERFLSEEKDGVPMVRDVTELSSIEINKLATYYTQMSNYTEGVALDFKCRLADAEKAKKNIESALKVFFHDEKKVKVTLCMDYVRSEASYQLADQECSRWWRCTKKAELSMNQARRWSKLLLSERVRRGEVIAMEAFENSSGKPENGWQQ